MCLYMEDGDEMLLDEGWRTAGKPHRCEECSRPIRLGERHYHIAVAYDGTVSGWRTCGHCRAAVTFCAAITGCPEAWYLGALWDADGYGYVADVLEHDLSAVDRWCVLRLVASARRRWRWSDGTLMSIPETAEDLDNEETA